MHSRVALSNIYLLKKMGAEVMVAGPPTLIPKQINPTTNKTSVTKLMRNKIGKNANPAT